MVLLIKEITKLATSSSPTPVTNNSPIKGQSSLNNSNVTNGPNGLGSSNIQLKVSNIEFSY